jgi:hypothetical protein
VFIASAIFSGLATALPKKLGIQILLGSGLGLGLGGLATNYYPPVATTQTAPVYPSLPDNLASQCAGYFALLSRHADDQEIGSWVLAHPECLAAMKDAAK